MQLLRKKGMLDSNRVLFLPVDAIAPNPDQPRRVFPQHELEELAASIRSLGLLQPLTVRRGERGWELVAGERRLRAAKLAGLTEVPCLSLQIDSQRSSLLALVENQYASTASSCPEEDSAQNEPTASVFGGGDTFEDSRTESMFGGDAFEGSRTESMFGGATQEEATSRTESIFGSVQQQKKKLSCL